MNQSTKKSRGSEKLKKSASLDVSKAKKIKDEDSENLKSPPFNYETDSKWVGPPTQEDREKVLSYAAFGVSDDEIAKIMRFSESTLKRHFHDELMQGRLQSKAKIGEKLYHIAVGYEFMEEEMDERGNSVKVKKKMPPNLTALIFLAKVRLGWKETQVVENIETKSQTILYLPDNGTADHKGAYGNDPNNRQDTIVVE